MHLGISSNERKFGKRIWLRVHRSVIYSDCIDLWIFRMHQVTVYFEYINLLYTSSTSIYGIIDNWYFHRVIYCFARLLVEVQFTMNWENFYLCFYKHKRTFEVVIYEKYYMMFVWNIAIGNPSLTLYFQELN